MTGPKRLGDVCRLFSYRARAITVRIVGSDVGVQVGVVIIG
jgi:hypothetical protein